MKLISIIMCLAFTACKQYPKTLTENEKEVIRNEIKVMFKKYGAAVQEKGLLGEFDYLDDSDDFYWVPPGYNSALSHDSVKSILTTNSKLYKSVKFNWIDLSIFPLSEKLVSYTGSIQSTMIDMNGKQNIIKMLESGLVIKRNDGWKLLSGQSRIKEVTSED